MKAARDEIWFRKIYIDLIKARKITTIFRPGQRLCNCNKGFCKGERLKIRIIDKVGADWAGVLGQILPDFSQEVQVLETKVITLGSLSADDFLGSSPDINNILSLRYHLGILYNLTPIELDDKAIITVTTFLYV